MEKSLVRDEMTPKERIKALLEGRPFDRIPCNPSLSDHAARVTGIKFRNTINPPQRWRKRKLPPTGLTVMTRLV